MGLVIFKIASRSMDTTRQCLGVYSSAGNPFELGESFTIYIDIVIWCQTYICTLSVSETKLLFLE